MFNKQLIFSDIECYPNWACIVMKTETGEHYRYIHTDNQPLDAGPLWLFINRCTLVGFNFFDYDAIIFLLMLRGASNAELHETSVNIIEGYKRPWEIIREKDLDLSVLDIIDIMPVLKGQAGLKLYAARIYFKKLQELPINPMKHTTPAEQQILLNYCCNDTDMTQDLFNEVRQDIELRITMSQQYGMDLRSKSGPGIAAAVLGHEYERVTQLTPTVPKIGWDIPLEMKYQKPNWISFRTPRFQQVLAEIEADTFLLNGDSGHLKLGKSVEGKVIQLEDRCVKLGLGGLHSIDGAGYYRADEERCIIDWDAASHYPSMILNSGWYPEHLGPEFLLAYGGIVERRLKAKADGDKPTAEALKLVINSSFGLFSMKYGILYSPNVLMNVTISGQLSLLMLTERLEATGHYLISANTDGVVINPKRSEVPAINAIIREFELDTGLVMEDTWYKTYVRRDVNNYFTVLEN